MPPEIAVIAMAGWDSSSAAATKTPFMIATPFR
jgi:hypothetical protein